MTDGECEFKDVCDEFYREKGSVLECGIREPIHCDYHGLLIAHLYSPQFRNEFVRREDLVDYFDFWTSGAKAIAMVDVRMIIRTVGKEKVD